MAALWILATTATLVGLAMLRRPQVEGDSTAHDERRAELSAGLCRLRAEIVEHTRQTDGEAIGQAVSLLRDIGPRTSPGAIERRRANIPGLVRCAGLGQGEARVLALFDEMVSKRVELARLEV